MFYRTLLTAMVALTAAVAHAPEANAQSQSIACFSGHEIARVVPHRTEKRAGRWLVDALSGASLFVRAERGLTAEWLQQELEQRLGRMPSADMCPLDVAGASVSVVSGGPGFWVRITGTNQKSAEEILRRAQALAR